RLSRPHGAASRAVRRSGVSRRGGIRDRLACGRHLDRSRERRVLTQALVLITFLVAIVILTLGARRLRVPYPIAFVVGGMALAFSGHLPRPHIAPDLILLLVVPPLLYSAAWTTDALELRKNIRPIALLAIGLVLFTTVTVAVFVHFLVPGFGWALAFTLGA